MIAQIVGLSLVATVSAGSEKWGYAQYCTPGYTHVAPENWNQLGNPACINNPAGDQTPIDVDCGVVGNADVTYSYSFPTGSYSITNNGHNVQINPPNLNGQSRGNTHVETMGQSDFTDYNEYKFLQAHVHWQKDNSNDGSEHSINGTFYPMEIHFVHYNADYASIGAALGASQKDSLQVLGVFFQLSQTGNPVLQQIIDAITASQDGDLLKSEEITGVTLNPCDFLGSGCGNLSSFNYYAGGLTTPPCNGANSSIVQWVLAEEFSTISQAQLDFFKTKIFADTTGDELQSLYGNSRPIMPLGTRTVYRQGNGIAQGTCTSTTLSGAEIEPTNVTFPFCSESPTASPPTASTATPQTTASPPTASGNVVISSVAVILGMMAMTLI